MAADNRAVSVSATLTSVFSPSLTHDGRIGMQWGEQRREMRAGARERREIRREVYERW